MFVNARDMQSVPAPKGYPSRYEKIEDQGHFSAVPSELGRVLRCVLKP
jgi:hypothetical protein